VFLFYSLDGLFYSLDGLFYSLDGCTDKMRLLLLLLDGV